MFSIVKKVVKGVVCHFLFHVRYEQVEKLNQCDRCLICPNHSNVFDPFFIFPETDNLFIMAKAELFKNKWVAQVLKHYQVFPVNREKRDVKASLKAIDLFDDNKPAKLLIFPEGKVLKTKEEIGKTKNGAVFIAATVDVPIIPVHITMRPKFFSRVEVKVGEPVKVSKEVLASKEKLRQESKRLIEMIYQL